MNTGTEEIAEEIQILSLLSSKTLAKQLIQVRQENERITKENVALNSRSELMDKHLQQYREERDSWINAAERLGWKRQQLREELEQVKAERDRWKEAENEWQKKASLRQL